MLHNLTGWHALVILTIVLLVFGSAKLPALARSVGQSMRILRDEAASEAPDIASGVFADRSTQLSPRLLQREEGLLLGRFSI